MNKHLISSNAEIIWEDDTTYGQGRRGKAAPKTWKLVWSGFHIFVTKHIHYGDKWTLYCPCLGYSLNKSLGTDDLDEAKEKAIGIIFDAAIKRRNELDCLLQMFQMETDTNEESK